MAAPGCEGTHTWRLDPRSEAPFHPQRLHGNIAALGGGTHRSRGCFWVTGRPDQIGVWEGAGGQLSIGVNGSRSRSTPFIRLLVTRTLDADVRGQVRAASAGALVTGLEQRGSGKGWSAVDGLEPWLGPTMCVA